VGTGSHPHDSMSTHRVAFTIRFDECAADGAARASTLLRYTVETAFAHSARNGFPLAWYDARGLYWLVRRAQVRLLRPIPYGAAVTVTTEVVGFRRIWARRRNVICDAAGAVVADIAMDWIFTDRAGRPVRIVPEMAHAFPTAGDPSRAEPLQLGHPPREATRTAYVVPAHQVDPRGHMHTAAYLDLFEDALGAAGVDAQRRPAVYEMEFLRQSLPGEVLWWTLWPAADAWRLRVAAAEGAEVTRALRRGPAGPP